MHRNIARAYDYLKREHDRIRAAYVKILAQKDSSLERHLFRADLPPRSAIYSGRSRTLFADARETALHAAAWYIRLYIRDKQSHRDWTRLKTMKFGATPQGGATRVTH